MKPKDRNYKYLFDINSPADLRKLPVSKLAEVSAEVREFMIDTITRTGGHFGAGLGVVELTVALHYVMDTPVDKLIFDTGHQGYPHKILTGRRDRLHTIRRKGGLSGFLKPAESEYDVFGAGHASTSISAALGIAAGRDLNNEDYRVAAIIGDGAMTGGLAFEAMNNCGYQKRDITVIMNDNNMSIDANVSGFSNYFNEIYASTAVQSLRDNIWELTGKMDEFGDRLRQLAARFEDGVKAIITPGVLFEAMGFKYFGPVNGHNIPKLVKMLKLIKDIKGPVFLHVMTSKGKGFAPAESDEHHLHAIGKIDRVTGEKISTGANKGPAYQDVFGNALTEIAAEDKRVCAITAAMSEGTGLDIFQKKFPDRFFDVGIAEGHAVTFAAGLASRGAIPVVAIYSTFLQRAYDNIVHDCALQGEHVVLAIDRAGLVGADGATHHGVLDLAFLRSVPNMLIMAPADEDELRDMLYTAIKSVSGGPVAVRYPRGTGIGKEPKKLRLLETGKSKIERVGRNLAVIAVGKTVYESLSAAEILDEHGISLEVINARFVKPLDEDMLRYAADKFDTLITVEDGQIQGGFGSAVLEFFAGENISINTILHGIPDKFIEHATQEELYADLGLDGPGIARKILNLYGIEAKIEGYKPESVKKS